MIARVEIGEFAQIRPPRHEDQPWKTRIVHQQHAREFQVADAVRIPDQAWVEDEILLVAHVQARFLANSASVRSSASFAAAAS